MGLMLRLKDDSELRSNLGIDEHSQIVMFALEGATDPELYEKFVGHTPDEIFARQEAIAAKLNG